MKSALPYLIRTMNSAIQTLLGRATFVSFLILGSVTTISRAESAVVRSAFSPNGGKADLVRAAIARATSRIDVAMFYFSSESLAQALCQAAGRGVAVRVALDSTMHGAAHRPLMERMARAGVEVRITQLPPGAKMHLRAAAIDDGLVMTGAANWSDAADLNNIEDVLCIEAPDLVPVYRRRIRDLFDSGVAPVTTTKRPPVKMSSSVLPMPWPKDGWRVDDIRAWHNPGPGALQQLIADLRTARRIDIGMYLLTNDQLIDTLASMATQAQVRLIVDAAMIGGAALFDLQTLRSAGVRVVSYRKDRGIMHLKSAVLDEHIVWTGSANWTKNAMQRNAEDMVRLDSAPLAEKYMTVLNQLEAAGDTLEAELPHSVADLSVVDRSGLPPTEPRKDFTNIRRTGATALVHQAWVSYVPDGEYPTCLLRLIRSARQTIGILMYVMPEHEGSAPFQSGIVDALVQAARRGVYVYLVLFTPPNESDRLARHHGNWAEKLRKEGLDVRLAAPGAPMHAKVVMVDQMHILVGSHNWSEGALSGDKIFESSALISLPAPDPRLAEYLFSRNVVSDMRGRPAWERELSVLRQLSSADERKRTAILKRAGYLTESEP